MQHQIQKAKTIAQDLASYRSEEFMTHFFELIKLLDKYFEVQAVEYIKSLDDYPELKINKKASDSLLKKFTKKIKEIYKLGAKETRDEATLDLARIGSSVDGDILISSKYALEFAQKQAGYSMGMINQTTANTINQIITDGIKQSQPVREIAQNIKQKFSDYTIYRSTLIATMEIAQAYGEGQKKQYDEYTKKLGVIGYKRSVTQKDSNVRESHRHNQDAGWIRRDQVYPGTGTMNAPHGFMCRCHDVNSITNPDTGMLYDEVPEYTDEQMDDFQKNWGTPMPISLKQRESMAKYSMTENEFTAIQGFTGNSYINFNRGYKNPVDDLVFRSGINFFINGLNKIPKYEGVVYRGHKVHNKSSYDVFSSLSKGDIFSYNSFFSSSTSKKIAESFLKSEYKVFFVIKTKKAIPIEEFSLYVAEKEALFLPKTLFFVENVQEKDKLLTITLSDL